MTQSGSNICGMCDYRKSDRPYSRDVIRSQVLRDKSERSSSCNKRAPIYLGTTSTISARSISLRQYSGGRQKDHTTTARSMEISTCGGDQQAAKTLQKADFQPRALPGSGQRGILTDHYDVTVCTAAPTTFRR
jgi:hypothetical protein